MVVPGAFSKTCLTGTSSKVLWSSTTIASPSEVPTHTILNANRVDPSIWFRLVAVVVKKPPTDFDVSIVYMIEPVIESRIVVFSTSSPVKEKDRSMLEEGDLWKCT